MNITSFRRLTRIEVLSQKVEDMHSRIVQFLGRRTEREYLESLCRQFVDIYPSSYGRAAAIIEDDLDHLEGLRDGLIKYGDEILNIDGYSDRYRAYERLNNRLGSIISSVNHLNGDAFVPEQFVEDFHSGRMAFQR